MEAHVKTQYVYLLQTREFVNANQPVYKIGRSEQNNLLRFAQYPAGSVLLFQSSCYDCFILEKEIIELFTQKYKHEKTLGREWFQGDSDKMIMDFCDIIKNERETPIRREIAPKIPLSCIKCGKGYKINYWHKLHELECKVIKKTNTDK